MRRIILSSLFLLSLAVPVLAMDGVKEVPPWKSGGPTCWEQQPDQTLWYPCPYSPPTDTKHCLAKFEAAMKAMEPWVGYSPKDDMDRAHLHDPMYHYNQAHKLWTDTMRECVSRP